MGGGLNTINLEQCGAIEAARWEGGGGKKELGRGILRKKKIRADRKGGGRSILRLEGSPRLGEKVGVLGNHA